MTNRQLAIEVLGRIAYMALGFIIAIFLFINGVI